ncbi:hypothetical protein L4C36_18335 [Photobacterium japonica]|uniref:hypothetical protein n=1 Tax=Photobacterium japonica TaxID=2910235 RepID=UPI003D12D15E
MKIRYLLFLTLSPFVSADTPDSLEWQGYCLPKAFLAPSSFMNNGNEKGQYDDATGFGPTLFIDGAYLSKQINGFQHTSSDKASGIIYHHLHANLSTQVLQKSPNTSSPLTPSIDGALLFDMLSPYHWDAYQYQPNNKQQNYQYWGSCMRDGHGDDDPSYRCNLQASLNKAITANYELHDENITLYQQINQWLITRLTGWQCESP